MCGLHYMTKTWPGMMCLFFVIPGKDYGICAKNTGIRTGHTTTGDICDKLAVSFTCFGWSSGENGFRAGVLYSYMRVVESRGMSY
jgi:hypothetical protein